MKANFGDKIGTDQWRKHEGTRKANRIKSHVSSFVALTTAMDRVSNHKRHGKDLCKGDNHTCQVKTNLCVYGVQTEKCQSIQDGTKNNSPGNWYAVTDFVDQTHFKEKDDESIQSQ